MVLLLVGRALVPDGAFTPPTTAASRGSSGWLRSQPMNKSSRTELAKDHERTTRIGSLLRSAVGDTAFTSGWTDNRQPIARTLGRTDAERGPARAESRLQDSLEPCPGSERASVCSPASESMEMVTRRPRL